MARYRKKAIGIRINVNTGERSEALRHVQACLDPLIRKWERILPWRFHPCYSVPSLDKDTCAVIVTLDAAHLSPTLLQDITRQLPFQVKKPMPEDRVIAILRHSPPVPFERLRHRSTKDNGDVPGQGRIEIDNESLNRLLLWLSSASQGGLARFEKACEVLGIQNRAISHVRRNLSLLGHIETQENRWSIAPPLLLHMPDQGRYIWCGGRDGGLRALLEHRGNLVVEPMSGGPDACYFEGDVSRIDPFRLEPKGILHLADLLPTLDQWRAFHLKPVGISGEEIVSLYDFKDGIWKDPVLSHSARRPGLYRVGSDFPYRYWLRDNGAWYSGEFYGLYFLAYSKQGRCQVIYDGSVLRCPLRWPLLYEKTLVLASGKLPNQNGGLWEWTHITAPLLNRLQSVLPLEIES